MTRDQLLSRGWPYVATVALAVGLFLACGDAGSNEVAVRQSARIGDSVDTSTLVGEPATAESAGDAAADSAGPMPQDGRPESLAAWRQISADGERLELSDGVTPYALNASLFSDYAHKLRTVWLPEGSSGAEYDPDDVFGFPVGTVITKTFWYPVEPDASDPGLVRKVAVQADAPLGGIDLRTARLIETRVLVHRADGWHALPYVWNDEQTDATLRRTGDVVRLSLVGESSAESAATPFAYVVPNENECAACHATNHTTAVIEPIGPKARFLNTAVRYEADDGAGSAAQLDEWVARGLLAGLPDRELPRSVSWNDVTAPLDARARAYLDINCAHCHNRVGPADTSGLFLEASTELGPRLGVCKPPVAAGTGTGGRFVGISPGDPEDSIFVFRMQTEDPAARMPELGRSLTHGEGVDLISAWIGSLAGTCERS